MIQSFSKPTGDCTLVSEPGDFLAEPLGYFIQSIQLSVQYTAG